MHTPYPPFSAIEQAMGAVISEMRAREIRLKKVEFITTAEKWDDSLGVLIFYDLDSDLVAYGVNGTTEAIKLNFLNKLMKLKTQFDFLKIPKINFVFDSHENVVNNFNGSYFLRLR